MATIYPSYITTESPRGERTVFSILSNHPLTKSWTVLHSFNLPDHGVRRKGEIDFLIMIPAKGIIALEVKSHDFVARSNGNWEYGNEKPTRRSPFEQAESAMYAFRDRIGLLGKGIPFSSAVAFTNTRFAEPAVEWKEWQVIDQSSMGADQFVAKLLAIADENLRELFAMKTDPQRRASVRWFDPSSNPPSNELISTITAAVRGDFEIYVDPRDLHKQREAEYKIFLDEQFEAIDAMAGEARILFEGAAGTGKTLLAVEEARRSHSREERTIVLCFNRLLGDFLRSELGDSGSYCGTLHSFIAQTKTLSTLSFPSSADDFDQLTRVVRAGKTFADKFDTIIIDEVQDFCSIGADQLIREIIEQNGEAKIRMFGDFENQAINFGSFISRQDFLDQLSNFRNYRLTRNCRNRPGIGGAIEMYTQKSDLYLGFRLPETSNNLRTVVADSHIDLLKQCESEFLRLSKTYLPSEIVILGLTGEISTHEVSDKFSPALTNDHIKWNNGPSKVLSTTVRKFKGLEAQAVILTNLPDEADIDLMYTGMSRAIEEIVIIAPRVVLARFIGIQS